MTHKAADAHSFWLEPMQTSHRWPFVAGTASAAMNACMAQAEEQLQGVDIDRKRKSQKVEIDMGKRRPGLDLILARSIARERSAIAINSADTTHAD